MTAKFTKNIAIEYVTVDIAFDNDWSGTVSIRCAGNTIGDGYFSGTSGSIKVQKGSNVEIDIDSNLYQSNVLIPSAGIDSIRLYPGGIVYNTYSISFIAAEDTKVNIRCVWGY